MTEETPPEEKQEADSVKEETQNNELVTLQKELKDCQEKYLLMLAESENSRKRMQKERQELTKHAVEKVLVEFLHPLDSFEKALQFAESMSDEVRNWAVGFEMLLNQFKQVLEQHGVHEYHSVGKQFDPHFHEAVEMIASTEYPPGVVIEEFARGYKVGDRPIRVARVKVAKAPEKINQENSEKG
jgi:molecular chaperone GrpE